MLVMTVLDGNGQVFPAALGIAESENTQTWTWFLLLVKTAFNIANGAGVVFLSDREKGIDVAVKRLFPEAAHAFCVYHIQKNVKVKFQTALNGLLFTATKATCENDFNDVVDKMKALHHRAGHYVSNIKPQRWARAFFPGRRFGHVISNISESMNWWLQEAMLLEPIWFFSMYIRKLNALFYERRTMYASMNPTGLPPEVSTKFMKSLNESRTLKVFRSSPSVFEVQSLHEPLSFRVVDFRDMSCSCGGFKEYGVPCRHMCAALLSTNTNPVRLVIPELRVQALQATYDGVTVPVDLHSLHDDGLQAPTDTRKRGRPKQKKYPFTSRDKWKTCRYLWDLREAWTQQKNVPS